MRLLIISHTPHYMKEDQIVGWGSTVREIDHLAALFDEVVHIAPLHPEQDPGSSLPYTSPKVRVRPVKPAGGNGFIDKLSILKQVPVYVRVMLEEMKTADIVHVRCPAAISLIALLLLIVKQRPTYRWVKYAGNWKPIDEDPLTYRFQRWLIAKNYVRGIGSINGKWAVQPQHLLTFVNPCLTKTELEEGQEFARQKQLTNPIQLLFVGRLEEAKGVTQVLQIAVELRNQGQQFRLRLIGDGTDREKYINLARKMRIEADTEFIGFVPRDKLSKYYQTTHFVLLPSSSEGWPKVLSEAMAYGIVVLASDVASIPQILQESGAGYAIKSNDVHTYAKRIIDLAQHPHDWEDMSKSGTVFASCFSYENYLQTLNKTFEEIWDIVL
jgi:glycosyltransferase involved in cell wall biosynthesis